MILHQRAALLNGYCEELAAFYRDHPELRETSHEAFWAGRIVSYETVLAHSDGHAAMIKVAVSRGLDLIHHHHGVEGPLYACAIHLVGWPPGRELPPHIDNAAPHVAHHEFSGMYYLTDDYEGGELYFPQHVRSYAPHVGDFISAPCGPDYEHGVRAVTSGLRLTLAFFATTQRAHAHRAFHTELR